MEDPGKLGPFPFPSHRSHTPTNSFLTHCSRRDPTSNPRPHPIHSFRPKSNRRKVLCPRRLLYASLLPDRQLQRLAVADMVYIPVVQDYESTDRVIG